MSDPSQSTSQNVFQAMQILISLSPVPGIAAVAILAQECYRRWERVKLRKSEVRELCEYGANVVMVINEHAQKVPYSSLEKPLNALKGTLGDVSRNIDLWANYGNAMAFLKNDEILAGIRKYRSDLAEALSMLSLQQSLNQEYWNQRFDAAGEADRLMLTNITNDIAALGQKMDQMQQYFANYRPYSREDPDGSQLSKVRDELFALRNEKKDEPVLPKREIEGEVQKIGSRPAHAGSMYDIWKGVWLGDYSVALKVFRGVNPRKKDTDRVNRQIDLWMSMRHPNILRLYGVCTLDKGPNPPTYFVSPWMKHRDAVTYCKAKPKADRLRIIYDVAKGLEYLHSVNIMHGGLQGSNVLVTLNGNAVLSDFSLSKVLDGGAMFTQSNGPSASLRWMSPEAHNQELMTDQSDVYSWGMTALQILSLQIPFYKIKAMGQLVVSITLRKVRPERADYQAPDITDPIWALFVECWKPAAERPSVQRILDVVGSERVQRKGWIPEADPSEDEQDTEYPAAF